MHYTQQKILLKDTNMKQSFTNHLPNCRNYLPGIPVPTDYLTLLVTETSYPFYILENDDDKQQHCSNKERNDEIIIWICVYLHLAFFSVSSRI